MNMEMNENKIFINYFTKQKKYNVQKNLPCYKFNYDNILNYVDDSGLRRAPSLVPVFINYEFRRGALFIFFVHSRSYLRCDAQMLFTYCKILNTVSNCSANGKKYVNYPM